MKPCPHCQQDNPIPYDDVLYCGNCNRAYPVTTRVLVPMVNRERYAEMRDIASELMTGLENLFANQQPPQAIADAYLWMKEQAEKYDEWSQP